MALPLLMPVDVPSHQCNNEEPQHPCHGGIREAKRGARLATSSIPPVGSVETTRETWTPLLSISGS